MYKTLYNIMRIKIDNMVYKFQYEKKKKLLKYTIN